MTHDRAPPNHHPRSTRRLVVAGALALAAAMGVGRFAFTPLLPLMLRDGTLAVSAGAEWAAANYVGYLVGAVTARWLGANPVNGLRWSLLGVVLTTLAIASDAALPAGPVLRAAAGVFSAWALICTSSVLLAELARRREARLGAWIYTGVGLGIAATGILTWLGGWQPAHLLWLELAVLAAAATLVVTMALGGIRHVHPAPAMPCPLATQGRNTLPLVLCYGVFGFGYIVPATFLPAMAHQQVSNPLVFGPAWPLFGLAAALSVAGSARWLSRWPRRRVWALAQGVMALGTALPVATQALWALAASAVLVGGTFMVATMAGLQLARETRPANPTPLLARMTMAFAAGQIAGPLFIWLFGPGVRGGWDAMACANIASTVLLTFTAAWLWHGGRSGRF